jgi:hypothetical protein
MESIDLYYDHYKDTFEHLKGYLKKRDNYTITLFILVIVLSFQISEPQESVKLADAFIQNEFKDVTIDFKYINTVLLFALLWLTILYYQINLLIEKMYKYVHEIEQNLSSDGIYPISREGKSYLKHYPWLSYIVHRIYTILFPLLIITIAGFKFYHEYKQSYDLLYIDAVAAFLIILSSILYLSNRHFKEEYYDKKLYPTLKWYQRFLGYFLWKEYPPLEN